MSNPIIQAENLWKSFGTLQIIRGVSLTVDQGEIVAIVGASGAGKTTLLQLISSLDAPDQGSVLINGTNIHQLKPNAQADFRNQYIGFVFQFHQLMPEFSAQENVAIPAMIAGRSKRQALQEARHLLQHLGLEQRLHHKPNALSGGEKQRVAVARALINNPSIIFADEPTGALDTDHKEELHQLFRQLQQERGQTFVIVSHDPAISHIAHRTIRLSDGTVQQA